MKLIVLCSMVCLIVASAVVIAADADDFTSHALTVTQRRPINGLGTVFYNEDPYDANLFQNTHGVRNYTMMYPEERQQFKFYGTAGYNERILKGLAVNAEERSQQKVYADQRRMQRLQELQEIYETPLIVREEVPNTPATPIGPVLDEPVFDRGYVPKFPVPGGRRGANYPDAGHGFYWPIINNDLVDDRTVQAIRTHARARIASNRELYAAYVEGLSAEYRPAGVATDVDFSYSGNVRLRESQLPRAYAHLQLPFYTVPPEDPYGQEYNPYHYI